jgi:FKBP-type peptidyl-prolyl cis-trans isomerase FklB
MKFTKLLICSGLALSASVSQAQVKKPTANKAPVVSRPSVPVITQSAPMVSSGSSFSSTKDSLSYCFGVLIAQNLKMQGLDVNTNPEILTGAIKDVLKGMTPKLSTEQAQMFVQKFMMKDQEKKMAEQAKQYEPNKLAGEQFLAENKKRAGVITTASGLQYEIIKAGDGPKPTLADKVKTHYHGTLINGEIFDSSVKRGDPISFNVTGVIAGWTEALQLMPVGSKWKLFIPQNLSYGPADRGTIKPYSALVFEIELLAIEK